MLKVREEANVPEAEFQALILGFCVCVVICTCLCVHVQLLPSQSSHLIAGCLTLGSCICPGVPTLSDCWTPTDLKSHCTGRLLWDWCAALLSFLLAI